MRLNVLWPIFAVLIVILFLLNEYVAELDGPGIACRNSH